tara:strand:+ start:8073 stop:8795 length:723 start_codon:yes stop_codon:yes gene_type:complete
MRAFYLESDIEAEIGKNVIISGETFNHLKVVRLKIGEEIILLNGRGDLYKAKLDQMDKKSAIVMITDHTFKPAEAKFDIAIGLVKKDAFDLCLKMAVELGANKIIPLQTQYSQRYDLNFERANRLLIQALEQSNAAWLPQLHEVISLTSFNQQIVDKSHNYSNIIVMGMRESLLPSQLPELNSPILGFIGPEGGFSEEEEEMLAKLSGASCVHLPTPILRAPTALAALGGVIFTKRRVLD